MNVSDIQKLPEQDDQPVDLPINQRNGEPYLGPDGKHTTFQLLGSESPTYKRRRDAAVKKLIASGAAAEEINRAKVAAGVIGWSGVHTDGVPLPFTSENLDALLKLDHVYNQANAGIGRYSSFFAKAS